jgi:zona occludens toxin
MITLYSGTPGSGKSLHAILKIWDYVTIKKGKKVIYNKPLYLKPIEKKLGKKGLEKLNQRLLILENRALNPELLIEFALKFNTMDKDDQTLLIIDEAADMFNVDELRLTANCFKWRQFFREHRHYGFEIILITQRVSMLDRQIRECIEIEVNHRNVKNFKWFGKLVSFVCGGMFSYMQRWVAVKPAIRDKGGFFLMNRRKAKIYRTHDKKDSLQTIKMSKRERNKVNISDFVKEYSTSKIAAKGAGL